MNWKHPKRYLWLTPATIPTFVYMSWLGAKFTGQGAFWWAAPIFAFGIIPVVDHLIGPNEANAPESVLERLKSDPFYRWATYLYLPNQYLSLIFACWLWAGGAGSR